LLGLKRSIPKQVIRFLAIIIFIIILVLKDTKNIVETAL